MGNFPPIFQLIARNRDPNARLHCKLTYTPPEAAARNSKAPFLFKCCRVDYNKETNRLEISRGEYTGKVVVRTLHTNHTLPEENDEDDDDTLVDATDQTDLAGQCKRPVTIEA